jgi:hypothetical protein
MLAPRHTGNALGRILGASFLQDESFVMIWIVGCWRRDILEMLWGGYWAQAICKMNRFRSLGSMDAGARIDLKSFGKSAGRKLSARESVWDYRDRWMSDWKSYGMGTRASFLWSLKQAFWLCLRQLLKAVRPFGLLQRCAAEG